MVIPMISLFPQLKPNKQNLSQNKNITKKEKKKKKKIIIHDMVGQQSYSTKQKQK
jgi:hypothetical protein